MPIPLPYWPQSHRFILGKPWTVKAGLAGKDVSDLKVTDLTRKGLDKYSLRPLPAR